ncbi:Rho GTPase activating protein [Coemansia sp. RSA 2322]|nr:Rho GTPase activating protein [Coemansia sp. RSA 2322]
MPLAGGERAMPADAMLDNDDSAAAMYSDDEVDVIRLVEERDAYRSETEKLRKIIERQRFIIKSLQDQIARKLGSSTANTPSMRNSDLSPEPMERPSPASASAASVASAATGPPLAGSSSAADNNSPEGMSAAAASSNALGLSSLTTTLLPNYLPAQRNISQGSFNAGQLPAIITKSPADINPNASTQRPWAKSTRLSEIYADYSARHNSVTPMFKSNAATSTEPANQPQPVAPIADASSFVDSLKSSICRADWPAGWNSHDKHDYSSDRLNDKRISSLVLDSSREASMSFDIEDRAELLLDSQPERKFVSKPSNAVSTPASHKHHSPTDTAMARDYNAEIYVDLSVASPLADSPRHIGSPSGQPASELLVLRPISLLAGHSSPGRAHNTVGGSNSRRPSDHYGDKPKNDEGDNEWKGDAIVSYEYSNRTADYSPDQSKTSLQTPWPAQEEVVAASPQAPPRPPQSVPQQPHPYAASPSFGPNSGDVIAARMVPTASLAASLPASTSTALEGDLLQTPEPTPRDMHRMPTSGSLDNRHSPSVAESDRDNFTDYDNGSGIPVPLRATATLSSVIEPYRHSPQPPLTSLRNIDIQIKDSRVKIDERGKEVNVYMVDIILRREISGLSLQEILIESQQAQAVMWTVEKRYSDFLNLNSQLQHVIHVERLVDRLERLPEKEIFRANAPTKNDKRKLWFEKYLKKALAMSFRDKRPLLEFLSTDCTMEPEKKMPILLGHKEGFLVKKGKNFGGWKRRYYVCKSNQPVLEYFEMPGSSVMGTINLSGAVVKTGKTPKDAPSVRARAGHRDADMFRHAFLIEERPRREGREPIAHPLWADSDRERDEWVAALRYVIVRDAEGPERAMEEVTKYLNYAKNKESNLLMIQQIQTSITHEQGARKSIEFNRRREEQQHTAMAAGSSSAGADEALARQAALQKIGSPLSKQVWPVTASLGDLAHSGTRNGDGSAVGGLVLAKPTVSGPQHAQKYDRGRPRSLSLPPIQDGEGSAPAVPRTDIGTSSTRPSPAILAATLSTSFSGCNDLLNSQTEHLSAHYVPSEISTIESSIYSSYNGHEGNARVNDISSRSIGDGNSYASEPDSPVSLQRTTEKATAQLAGRVLGVTHPTDSASSFGVPPSSYDGGAGPFPDMSYYNRHLGEHAAHAPSPSADGRPRAQFTKDSVGRIVREEEHAPDLPLFTPHVTDDILGVGRQDVSHSDSRDGGNQGALSSIFNGGRTRTREEKKRGRITFMWGKRKPSDTDHAHSDLASPVGSNTGPYGGGLDTPPVSAPRRLRRGSTSNDARGHHKQVAFRGPVFGLPLERVVEMTRIREHYHLPAVVYRCIEYLDSTKAWMEEGIYRQSGSSLALNVLRKEFNSNRDYNLLKLPKLPDAHAVASLLKAYLRELPESVLTIRLRQDFVRVIDLAERHDRVHELGRLVSELPLANYTLLRALTAHLIRIVQKASTNLMTLRNIGIVFSPSLGIPVGVFNLLMVEFEYIFWVNDSGAPEPRSLSVGPDGVANAPANSHATTDKDHQKAGHSLDVPLSISVPAGIDRMATEDYLYSAGSNAGTDCYSLASDIPAHPPRTNEDKGLPTTLRAAGPRHEIGGATRAQDDAPPVANAPWYTQPDPEFLSGLDMPKDLSRYPGMPSSSAPKSSQQQQKQHRSGAGQLAGRSNRNSIQYNVGAPRELIFQEAEISVPATISEDDDDDDGLSSAGDPMMRLSRYASNHTLKSNNASLQH